MCNLGRKTSLPRKARVYALPRKIYPQRLGKVLINLLRTIGYGEITGIKPAKKLFKEQEEQLVGDKKEKKEV